MTPLVGLCLTRARESALKTSAASIREPLAQPKIIREYRSITTARCSHPSAVQTYVMSLAEIWCLATSESGSPPGAYLAGSPARHGGGGGRCRLPFAFAVLLIVLVLPSFAPSIIARSVKFWVTRAIVSSGGPDCHRFM